MIVQELITKLGFEVDDKALKDLDEGIKAITAGVVGLTAAAFGTGLSLLAFSKTSTDATRVLGDLAYAVGLSVEKISEYDAIAQGAGTSTEELNISLLTMSKNLDTAKNGSAEMARQFEAVGITSKDLSSGVLTADAAIEKIAENFAKLPEGPERAAVAMTIFGGTGPGLLSFLGALSAGVTPAQRALMRLSQATDEQVESASKFQASYGFLEAAVKGILRTVGVDLSKVLGDILDKTGAWVAVNEKFIKQNIAGFVNGVAKGFKVAAAFAEVFVSAMLSVTNVLGGVENMVTLLIAAFTLMSGSGILFGIGKLVMALQGLRFALVTTQLTAIAVPLAIGAAILAVILLFQDLYVFLDGGESLIGDFFKKFPELAKSLKNIFGPIFQPIYEIFKSLTDGTATFESVLLNLGKFILNSILTPFRLTYEIVKKLVEIGQGDATGPGTFNPLRSREDESLADRVFSGGETPTGVPQLELFPILPAVSPTQTSRVENSDNRSTNTNNTINQTLEFNFPPGTQPSEATGPISKAVDEGVVELLRNAGRTSK